tara:strand:- start:71 stop:394 length:324 start_codon:yes stop_codon:yes gene_type:complete
MKNFQKKENNLNNLIDKLSHIHKSYSHFEINNDHLEKGKDLIKDEKLQLEKKNNELLREHKYLRDKILKLETELKSKAEIEKKFHKDIDDLNQETENLVEEIEKWQM